MKYWIAGAIALALPLTGCESTGGDYGGVLGEVLGGISQGQGAGALSQAEIDAGLREALVVGTGLVANQLGRTDGYYGDPQIHIPLTGRLADLQRQTRQIGLSGPLDEIELRMNRAAEAAIPEAKTLILGAIRQITIEDALQILNGGDTAATDFLRAKTEAGLRERFTPYLRQELAQAGAFQAIENTAGQYGLSGLTTQLQNDLTNHAVGLGLDGVFFYVAQEEKKIREDPVARTTEILRRVFGSR